jgi:hypothetical protein
LCGPCGPIPHIEAFLKFAIFFQIKIPNLLADLGIT